MALLECQVCWGTLMEGLVWFGVLPRWLGVDQRLSLLAGNGREVLPEGWEWSKILPQGWEWSGGHPDGPGVVQRLSLLAWNGREALLEGREWLEGPPCGMGVVRRPF